ncbi:Yip1 family protein [Actinacidiphila sp. ITFR-21]|uniref:Yip1 family protein n=1 Tax=Actinacidiphila sp. ITFR-21 TaxID=3075199 RepID=UPI0037DA510A
MPAGEPEYYAPAPSPGQDDAPGHTRAFTFGGDASLADPQPGSPHYGDDNVATYRAGQAATPPAGPRLHWKDLLRGIVRHPGRTFWQTRDHKVWAPALIVTFVYGLLAVFGFDAARNDILDATLATSVPWVLTTGVAVVLCGLTLGAVTNTLARQLGGDGAWAPTVGLAMIITSLTDAPRLLFAIFLGGGNGFVQLLGWLTWFGCAWLLTSMVGKSHDLPWLKALGASSIQLLALLMLFKLPLI